MQAWDAAFFSRARAGLRQSHAPRAARIHTLRPMKSTTMLLAGAALLAATGSAVAVDFKPDGVSLEAGIGKNGARMAGVGLVWDWDFERMRRKSELTAHTELMLNGWRAEKPDRSGDRFYSQVVLLPSIRMRMARGASPVFLEFGIGLSWMNRKLETPDRQFSTQWNFYDVLGLGYTIGGPQGKNEIDVRLVHFSNAGIKNPNPGLNFLQLRYSHEF